jgi:hypothetical protein
MGGKFDIAVRKASTQHGRVSWQQLVDEGIDDDAIQRWLDDHRLQPVHHGIYAVGHVAPSPDGDLMAAVLACGDGAKASHASTAYLLGVFRTPPAEPEITVPTLAGRSRNGINVHRVSHLHHLDTMRWRGIPTTTGARMLLDLAPRTPLTELTRAYHELWVRKRARPEQIEACIARNPRKPGASKLRSAIGSDATLSGLEDGFLALLRTHRLPRPRTNIDHEGDKVDCHWPEYGVTIELVSFRYHATRHAFEQDVARRRRSNHIQYSWGDVFERGTQTARGVARLSVRAGRWPDPNLSRPNAWLSLTG